jgi:Na+/H+ antiporter NhaC
MTQQVLVLQPEVSVALVLLVLLLALLFFGLGFAAHLLWVVAVIIFFVWRIGWAFARGEASGSRRQWYGRW